MEDDFSPDRRSRDQDSALLNAQTPPGALRTKRRGHASKPIRGLEKKGERPHWKAQRQLQTAKDEVKVVASPPKRGDLFPNPNETSFGSAHPAGEAVKKELARGGGGGGRGKEKKKRPCEQAGARQQVQRPSPTRDPKDQGLGERKRRSVAVCVCVCARPDPRGRRGGRQAQILMRVPLARMRKKGKMRSWKEALKVWMWVMLSAL